MTDVFNPYGTGGPTLTSGTSDALPEQKEKQKPFSISYHHCGKRRSITRRNQCVWDAGFNNAPHIVCQVCGRVTSDYASDWQKLA